jgi:cobalt-zinc-cadmium efflux system protein
MSHTHSHSSTGIRLVITIILNFTITVAEIIGGIISGSLSLISDALHNFSDGVSVIISYFAIRLKRRDYSSKHTFGFKRAEILAAVINSSVLVVISIYLFYESIIRFQNPEPIKGVLMTTVATIGLTANIIGTLLLKRDAATSINIRSSYLHLLTDAISSVAVILGGLAIVFWNIYWIDPVLTILIAVYITRESFKILSDAIHVLMEGAPPGISIKDIQNEVEALDEVEDIHHLHIWTVGENARVIC